MHPLTGGSLLEHKTRRSSGMPGRFHGVMFSDSVSYLDLSTIPGAEGGEGERLDSVVVMTWGGGFPALQRPNTSGF